MGNLPGLRSALLGVEPQELFPVITERELRAIAWNSCGILRNGPELKAAVQRIEARELKAVENPTRADYELRNIHRVAALIATAALAREESRGGHYRIDFPAKSASFERHSVLALAPGEVNARLTFA
jgi:L-aspartate oxidase